MKALVVYESHFGNTGRVARAVAAGLRTGAEVEVLDVADAPPVGAVDADLLVIGAPTHVLGLSRPDSRREAMERAGLEEESRPGIREWLEEGGELTVPVAVYDTRTHESKLPGSAARAVVRRLRQLKVPVVAPPEHFAVHGSEGPLAPGEEERATEWGRGLLVLPGA
ncbi:Flavodoxin [Georgenia satyanarayanai]|uniref:Flavodoxin n=1 Tax=Georgenia satyanarayanai TaxID=860221 RepID=A0A2Y9ANT3_9MICO|nr:flavodoxin domain-containing protein [Georgenia satyanarayanai]PYF99095.1 flavodoxin-like protein [Georgenia satyanarayanai]SSA44057.1 Flavodoxin [Georgenia satyanarayanai]